MLHTWNSYNVICPLHLKKTKKQINKSTNHTSLHTLIASGLFLPFWSRISNIPQTVTQTSAESETRSIGSSREIESEAHSFCERQSKDETIEDENSRGSQAQTIEIHNPGFSVPCVLCEMEVKFFNLLIVIFAENKLQKQRKEKLFPNFRDLTIFSNKWLVSQVAGMVNNSPANTGDVRDIRDASLIPESGRSPEGGHGNPPQYSCLENPMERGAWWATVHGVAESWMLLKWLSVHTHSNKWLE